MLLFRIFIPCSLLSFGSIADSTEVSPLLFILLTCYYFWSFWSQIMISGMSALLDMFIDITEVGF